jgi:hypothetical protein
MHLVQPKSELALRRPVLELQVLQQLHGQQVGFELAQAPQPLVRQQVLELQVCKKYLAE